MRPVVEFGDNFARRLFEHERQNGVNQRRPGGREQETGECQREEEMLPKAFIDRGGVGGEEGQNLAHVISPLRVVERNMGASG